jgi:pilus assembly protein CpaB
MKKVGKQLILISFFLAVIASAVLFIYLNSLNNSKNLKIASKKITVLVAAQSIPARTKIDKKMIAEVQVTDDDIFKGCIKKSSLVIGKYTKESMSKNEVFYKEKLFSSDGTEFSLNIQADHRAISLNVTGDSAVSYLLKPQDYVDIIAYLPEKKDAQKVIRPETAKLILQNIEVLAIDRQSTRDVKQPDKMPNNFLITLSVPTTDIEKIVLAEDIGNLKFALRPLNSEDDAITEGATCEQLLNVNTSEENVSEENMNSDDISSAEDIQYTVKKGDTLKSISEAFYGDPDKYPLIKEANNIENEDIILIGEIIIIPSKASSKK